MTQEQIISRHLGGESAHRSFFGGTHTRGRVVGLAISIVAGMILTPLMGAPGLLIGIGGVVVTLLLTIRTHRGSIADRRLKRKRWASRVKLGTDAFVPYEVGAWDQLQQALEDTATLRGRRRRREAWKATRAIAGMRGNPDGADGMGWLEFSRRVPGVAWHAPLGEQPYLSATFSVSGQLRGTESPSMLARAARSWGSYLASQAVASALVNGVQITTRVLPSDTALQENWVLDQLDTSSPAEAQQSYNDVLTLTGTNAMVQRHYVTLKWPLDADFFDAASKYGEGRDGWRGLMQHELDSAARSLTAAKLGRVEALTARQTAAVILHMQNPDLSIDGARFVDPRNLGVASYDEFSAHVVQGIDPVENRPNEWWHRTAAIRADAMSTEPRGQLWLLPVLIGRDKFVRTISLHIDLVPAAEAKAAATSDLVRDTAAAMDKREAGQLSDGTNELRLSAAQRRKADLVSGSHHQGATWIGFVTISVRSKEELARASRQLADTVQTGLGIDRLDWLDSYQSSASGTTWPIGRGLAPGKATFSTRVYDRLAGKSEKEAIS